MPLGSLAVLNPIQTSAPRIPPPEPGSPHGPGQGWKGAKGVLHERKELNGMQSPPCLY